MRRNSGRELRNGQCGFQGHLDGRFTHCDECQKDYRNIEVSCDEVSCVALEHISAIENEDSEDILEEDLITMMTGVKL